MILVVDASVACKWFVAENDAIIAEAVFASGGPLLAPDLIVAEVGNIAWAKERRGEISGDQAVAMAEGIVDMFDELIPSAALVSSALSIARSLNHPIYDCFYLALAEAKRAKLISADGRLEARCRGTPWEAAVTPLAGFSPVV